MHVSRPQSAQGRFEAPLRATFEERARNKKKTATPGCGLGPWFQRIGVEIAGQAPGERA